MEGDEHNKQFLQTPVFLSVIFNGSMLPNKVSGKLKSGLLPTIHSTTCSLDHRSL